MPRVTVTLTDYEFDLYERGHYVTILKPEPVVKRYIVVKRTGMVLEFSTIDGKPHRYKVLRTIPGHAAVGYVSFAAHNYLNPEGAGRDAVVTEVSA